jgi:hypothetical protein
MEFSCVLMFLLDDVPRGKPESDMLIHVINISQLYFIMSDAFSLQVLYSSSYPIKGD